MRYRRNPTIETAPLQQEVMLFNASTKKFCVLNPSAAVVWQHLEEPRTAEELAGVLREHFTVNGATSIDQDVKSVLNELEHLDLVSRVS